MKKPKLTVYEIRFVKLGIQSGAWVMSRLRKALLFQRLDSEHKRQFVARCAKWCRLTATADEPISLRIFTRDRSWVVEERTYPRSADPKRSRG